MNSEQHKVCQAAVDAMAGALGGEGWDDPRLVDIVANWLDWSAGIEIDMHAQVDDLIDTGFDPRHLLPEAR